MAGTWRATAPKGENCQWQFARPELRRELSPAARRGRDPAEAAKGGSPRSWHQAPVGLFVVTSEASLHKRHQS